MIVAVHQPQYLPWLGYFDKMRRADMFCFLDNVQYKKNDWQNRNRLKTDQGWQWLTVPVSYRFRQKINEVKINHGVDWKRKHLQALITNYNRAPYFREYMVIFEQIFSKDWDSLSELNVYVTERLKELLGLQRKPTFLSSNFMLRDDPTDRLIDICKELGADTYLSGQDGVNYMDLARFQKYGLSVIIQDFNHPVYPQLYTNFQSHLSIVDLLFNCGPTSMEIIREANLEP